MSIEFGVFDVLSDALDALDIVFDGFTAEGDEAFGFVFLFDEGFDVRVVFVDVSVNVEEAPVFFADGVGEGFAGAREDTLGEVNGVFEADMDVLLVWHKCRRVLNVTTHTMSMQLKEDWWVKNVRSNWRFLGIGRFQERRT